MIHPKIKVNIGKNCQIDTSSYIGYRENGKGLITLGDKTIIRHDCLLRTCGGSILTGSNVVINYGFICHAMGGVAIGKNTLISPNVSIFAQNHGIARSQLIRNQKQTGQGILILDDVWIGAGSIILDGVTIGEGAVVGAGSVVTKSIPAYEIWAGNAAQKIGERK